MANIKDFIKKIGNSAVSLEEQQQALAQVEQTIIEAKQKRTEAVGKNADMVIQALKTIEAKLEAKLAELNNTPAKQGVQGPAGQDGKNGKDGKAGRDGVSGKDGTDGKDGVDGQDGVSVVDAKIDFDGSLVVYLSNGSEIDCGQILQPEVAKNIIISSGGSGTSQVVTDTLVSLQNQINTLTGIDGVLGDMAQQNANAVAITGGTINGTTIGATTPSSVNATTITGQTGVLNGTGQNLFLYSEQFNNAAWTKTSVSITADSTTAPNGTTTADTVTASVGTSAHDIDPLTGSFVGMTTGLPYVISVYAKKGTNDFFQICLLNQTSDFANFDLNNGIIGTTGGTVTASMLSVGDGWYRCSLLVTIVAATRRPSFALVPSSSATRRESWTAAGTETVFLWGAQLDLGSNLGVYTQTVATTVFNTTRVSFNGISEIGLLSTGALYLQPAGTGALQAQATTSTTAGGNARGANAVDWQTSRATAAQVASAIASTVSGGANNTNTGTYSFVGGGFQNTSSANGAGVVSGSTNVASGQYSFIGAGVSNTASGFYGFVGNGFTNSTTSSTAVTTQATTAVTSGSTAVTLSATNASIRVGQLISGTGISNDTYVSAISTTSLTLSKNATATGTPTLSFFTPHGVVVGGGNNQATGSYSFIGGGGDAGTAANRNTASGDWSFVGGGVKNTATGNGSAIGGGGYDGFSINGNTASGGASFVGGGQSNTASGAGSSVLGGLANAANAGYSTVLGGRSGTTRSIIGIQTFSACNIPIASGQGVSQSALLILGRQTTDATPTALASDTSAAGTTNQVILPNNSAYYFKGSVIAGKTAAGDTSAWVFEGAIKRGANAGTTTLVAAVTPTLVSQDAGASGWVLAIAADTTNGGLKVTVTGQASTTIRWVCRIQTTEMTF